MAIATPDDEMMRDVRIVHDEVGVYADWMVVNGLLPYGNSHHDYLVGKTPPRYPVPAIPLEFRVSTMGIWAGIFNRNSCKVHRWWHKRVSGDMISG